MSTCASLCFSHRSDNETDALGWRKTVRRREWKFRFRLFFEIHLKPFRVPWIFFFSKKPWPTFESIRNNSPSIPSEKVTAGTNRHRGCREGSQRVRRGAHQPRSRRVTELPGGGTVLFRKGYAPAVPSPSPGRRTRRRCKASPRLHGPHGVINDRATASVRPSINVSYRDHVRVAGERLTATVPQNRPRPPPRAHAGYDRDPFTTIHKRRMENRH